MSRKRTLKTIILFSIASVAGWFGWSQLHAEPLDERILAASNTIKQAIQSRKFRSTATLADWQQVINQARNQLPAEHYAVEMLNRIQQQLPPSADQFSTETVEFIKQELTRVQESITFRRVDEAPLPLGYPETTPLHHIQVKQYPAYRLAKTSMNGSQNGSFWTLFKHIKRHDIAMTAPVEMQHESADPEAQETSMAFLYRNPEMGMIGLDSQDEKVEVVDVPPMMVVSIGCKGSLKESQIQAAATRLQDWLVVHDDEYEIAGPMRTQGYNSPFVPGFQRYFEVQIPVQRK